jgi:hypothetical protein
MPITPARPPITFMDTERLVRALESIAASLASIEHPTRAGKPEGEGLLKVLTRLTEAAEKLAAK